MKAEIKLEKGKPMSCHTQNHLLSTIASPDNIEVPELPSLPDVEDMVQLSHDDDTGIVLTRCYFYLTYSV